MVYHKTIEIKKREAKGKIEILITKVPSHTLLSLFAQKAYPPISEKTMKKIDLFFVFFVAIFRKKDYFCIRDRIRPTYRDTSFKQ
jgi:hypothetical protein